MLKVALVPGFSPRSHRMLADLGSSQLEVVSGRCIPEMSAYSRLRLSRYSPRLIGVDEVQQNNHREVFDYSLDTASFVLSMGVGDENLCAWQSHWSMRWRSFSVFVECAVHGSKVSRQSIRTRPRIATASF
jgi:hypothetical protein